MPEQDTTGRVLVKASDGKTYAFPPGSDEAQARRVIEDRIITRDERVRRVVRPTVPEMAEDALAKGGAAVDPTGGVIARHVARIVAHPIDNAPAIGATLATLATGGTAAVPLMVAAGLGAAGGSGVRSAYRQLESGRAESPDAVIDDMIGEGALNAALAGVSTAAPGAMRSVGNAFGRAAAKIPASLAETVPGFSTLGQFGARRALIAKAYDKGLIPGTGDAAFNARKGPGGIDALNASVRQQLLDADAAGTRINVGTEVAPVFPAVRAGYASNPTTAGLAGRRAVDAERAAFKTHPEMSRQSRLGPWRTYRNDAKPSSLNEAKVAINRGIAEGSWAEQSAPATQTQKALSGQMSKTLRARVSGVASTLDDEAMMLPLEEVLQLAAARGGNRDVLSLKGFAAPGKRSVAGFLDRPAAWGYAGYGLDKAGRALETMPPSVRLAVLEALRSRLGSAMPTRREE